MGDRRYRVSISFPREQEHVWELLQEHCLYSNQTTRSAAIVTLLEKALTSSTSDGDGTADLYEFDRLSKQIDECRQRIEDLGELILGRFVNPEREEDEIPDSDSVTDDDWPDQDDEEPEPTAADVPPDGGGTVTGDDEPIAEEDEKPNAEAEVQRDDIPTEMSFEERIASEPIVVSYNDDLPIDWED